jgi:hypothetical protein
MKKRITLLFTLFYVFLQIITAQPVNRLQNTDVRVKGILYPLKTLPDSIKTYQIISSVEIDPRYASIDEKFIQSTFQFESYEKTTENPHLKLFVNVKKARFSSALRTRKDTTKQVFYWIEERIEPQIEVLLKHESGQLLYSSGENKPIYYRTPEKKSERAAQVEFSNRIYDPVYTGSIADEYDNALSKQAKLLRNNYNRQTETISLYYPPKPPSEFRKTLSTIEASLLQVNKGKPMTEIFAGLRPSMEYLEKNLAEADPNSKAGELLYAACCLNLAHIYRCFDDYERTFYYIRLLIKTDFEDCKDIVKYLADMKERYDLRAYYKKTGLDFYYEQRLNAKNRLDTLKKQNDAEGYIVLNNNEIVKGTLINLIENYQSSTVKLKYEKKLNAPITDITYPLVDVSEIHIKDWDLFVVPFNSKFYLAEKVYQSPSIIMGQSLYGMGTRASSSKQSEDNIFLLKHDERAFTVLQSKENAILANYMNDCPTIARQIKYGYYTSNQILAAVVDYDTTCGSKLIVDKGQPIIIKRKLPPSPNFFLGFSTGINNITSILGGTATIRIYHKTFVRLGAGIGLWGAKFSGGIKYDLRRDMRYKKGWSLAMGYGHSTGGASLGNLTVSMDSSTSVAGGGTTTTSKEIVVRPLPVNTMSISTIYNRFLNRKVAFVFEFGYAIALQKDPWIVIEGQNNLKALKPELKVFQPGGLILAVGMNFGL